MKAELIFNRFGGGHLTGPVHYVAVLVRVAGISKHCKAV